MSGVVCLTHKAFSSADQRHRRWISSELYTQLCNEVWILPLLQQGNRDAVHVANTSCPFPSSPLFSAPVSPALRKWTVCLCLQDLAGGMVVSDIQLISDKESVPHGYCYIAEHLEPSECKHQHVFVCLYPHTENLNWPVQLVVPCRNHYTYI